MDQKLSIAAKKKSNSKPSTPRTKGLIKSNDEPPPRRTSSKNSTRPHHRPFNSYGGQGTGFSDRFEKAVKENFVKNSLKASKDAYPSKPASRVSPRKSSPPHSAPKHRRTTSLADRPETHAGNRNIDPEMTHKRKFSLERPKEVMVVSSFAHRSQKGFIPGNPQKQNQDNFIECVNFGMSAECYFYSVCDGHGLYGGEVSGYIKQRFPTILSQDPNLLGNPRRALISSVIKVNSELNHQEFDISFSGSTMVSVLIRGKKLWCANTGDSRALLGRQLSDAFLSQQNIPVKQSGKHWMSIALSRDHKPDDQDESVRILHCGGRIEAYQDEQGNPLGPARVWLKHQDIPGLAMSRSVGDGVASSVGVICDPEILEFSLTPDDKFLVIGSDGIFEFLSNEEVVKIVVPYWKTKDVQGACDALAKEANHRWTIVRFM